jgi:hypothetical protein
MRDRSSGSWAVDVEHRAVAICPGLNEVKYERRGESDEKWEPVAQRHWLNHQPVLADQAEPGERLRKVAPLHAIRSLHGWRLRALISSARSPLAIVDCGQSAVVSVLENTTLGCRLSAWRTRRPRWARTRPFPRTWRAPSDADPRHRASRVSCRQACPAAHRPAPSRASLLRGDPGEGVARFQIVTAVRVVIHADVPDREAHRPRTGNPAGDLALFGRPTWGCAGTVIYRLPSGA